MNRKLARRRTVRIVPPTQIRSEKAMLAFVGISGPLCLYSQEEIITHSDKVSRFWISISRGTHTVIPMSNHVQNLGVAPLMTHRAAGKFLNI